MNKEAISTDGAPSAVGPYSQAIRSGQFVFLSGQVALDPATMKLVEGSIEDRAHRVFENLGAVARQAGGDLDQIVKLTIYLTDLDNFASVNNAMADYFQEPYPARATIGVASLPLGADIEVEAILAV